MTIQDIKRFENQSNSHSSTPHNCFKCKHTLSCLSNDGQLNQSMKTNGWFDLWLTFISNWGINSKNQQTVLKNKFSTIMNILFDFLLTLNTKNVLPFFKKKKNKSKCQRIRKLLPIKLYLYIMFNNDWLNNQHSFFSWLMISMREISHPWQTKFSVTIEPIYWMNNKLLLLCFGLNPKC